jgi:prophage regulatory protein
VQNQIFLTDNQVAQRYGVKRASIWRWLKDRDFPKPVKLSPGCTRWQLSALMDWEQSREVGDV